MTPNFVLHQTMPQFVCDNRRTKDIISLSNCSQNHTKGSSSKKQNKTKIKT